MVVYKESKCCNFWVTSLITDQQTTPQPVTTQLFHIFLKKGLSLPQIRFTMYSLFYIWQMSVISYKSFDVLLGNHISSFLFCDAASLSSVSFSAFLIRIEIRYFEIILRNKMAIFLFSIEWIEFNKNKWFTFGCCVPTMCILLRNHNLKIVLQGVGWNNITLMYSFQGMRTKSLSKFTHILWGWLFSYYFGLLMELQRCFRFRLIDR